MPDILQNALTVFDTHLRPYKYIYELSNGKTLELKFNKGDLMHMLGLNRFPKYAHLKKKNVQGVGSLCYQDIKKGKLTEEKANKIDSFSFVKSQKIDGFHLYPDTLLNNKTVLYDFNASLIEDCDLNSDYMLHNTETGYHCHVGVLVDGGVTVINCCPETWFTRSNTPLDLYTDKQTVINIINFKKVRRSNNEVIETYSNVEEVSEQVEVS